MILVTLGTQDKSFHRLLEALEKQIELGNIKEEVIVQAGNTKFQSQKMKILDFIPYEEFDHLMEKCDLLITHGGVGSIITGLKHQKKVIAVPRLRKYKEHGNDHQLQIIHSFDQKGYILPLIDLDSFEEVLKKSVKFKPKKYKSNTKKMMELVSTFIETC